MSSINRRHVAGVVLGGLAAWVVILLFLSAYAVLYGQGFLSPFEGSRDAFGVTGTAGLAILLLLDLFIPLLAGTIFLVALEILSRTNIALLGFSRASQAVTDGVLLGVTVWALLYVPVLFVMSHATLPGAYAPLALGLLDHLAFGITLVLIVFWAGGPIPFGSSRRSAPSP